MRSLHSIHASDRVHEVDTIVDKEYSGWQSIIDSNSPYKMLYSLQILNTLVSVNNQLLNDIELQERHEWRQRFLELGGFKHLYIILITSDVSEMLIVNPPAQNQNLNDQSKKIIGNNRLSKKSRSKLIK